MLKRKYCTVHTPNDPTPIRHGAPTDPMQLPQPARVPLRGPGTVPVFAPGVSPRDRDATASAAAAGGEAGEHLQSDVKAARLLTTERRLQEASERARHLERRLRRAERPKRGGRKVRAVAASPEAVQAGEAATAAEEAGNTKEAAAKKAEAQRKRREALNIMSFYIVFAGRCALTTLVGVGACQWIQLWVPYWGRCSCGLFYRLVEGVGIVLVLRLIEGGTRSRLWYCRMFQTPKEEVPRDPPAHIEENSIDLYASVKSLYIQNRSKQINNSKSKTATQDDSDWEEIDTN